MRTLRSGGRLLWGATMLLLAAVGCRDAVDPGNPKPAETWRLVRVLCTEASCDWIASDPDGEAYERLFTTDGLALCPSPSPDGTRIAYIKWPSFRLMVRTLATQAEADLAWPRTPECVAWSPDGRQLAVEEFDETARMGAIRLVQPDGMGSRLLTEGLFNAIQLSWSPDGAELLVTRNTGQLVLLDGTTGTTQRVVDEYGEWGVWSPDGRQIAYTRNRETPPAFHLVNRDGTGSRLVTATNPADPANASISFVFPSFSPDGRFLVGFRAGQVSEFGLFRMTLDGTRAPWGSGEMVLPATRAFWLRSR